MSLYNLQLNYKPKINALKNKPAHLGPPKNLTKFVVVNTLLRIFTVTIVNRVQNKGSSVCIFYYSLRFFPIIASDVPLSKEGITSSCTLYCDG